MKHNFERQEIPRGKNCIIEICECGVQSRRYRATRTFLHPDGKWSPKVIECRRSAVVKVSTHTGALIGVVDESCPGGGRIQIKDLKFTPAEVGIISTDEDKVRPEDIRIFPLKPLPKEYAEADEAVRNRQFRNRCPPPGPEREAEKDWLLGRGPKPPDRSPEDAMLKDAYVIIQVMFEEMVTAGMRTPGRRMAGTLLHSAGYSEIVKKLESHEQRNS